LRGVFNDDIEKLLNIVLIIGIEKSTPSTLNTFKDAIWRIISGQVGPKIPLKHTLLHGNRQD